MKKNIRVFENGEYIEKEINYIPIKYIISILLAIFEIVSIIAILVLLAMYVPYFYIAIYITVVAIEIHNLIIDNELMRCIENAALRGVDVRIVIPHIPDKKLIFELSRSSAEILTRSNVLVYEY